MDSNTEALTLITKDIYNLENEISNLYIMLNSKNIEKDKIEREIADINKYELEYKKFIVRYNNNIYSKIKDLIDEYKKFRDLEIISKSICNLCNNGSCIECDNNQEFLLSYKILDELNFCYRYICENKNIEYEYKDIDFFKELKDDKTI